MASCTQKSLNPLSPLSSVLVARFVSIFCLSNLAKTDFLTSSSNFPLLLKPMHLSLKVPVFLGFMKRCFHLRKLRLKPKILKLVEASACYEPFR